MLNATKSIGFAAAFAVACALALAQRAQAAEATTEDPQAQFEKAMDERSRGALRDAIRTFNSVLDENPGLRRARIELAVAYYQSLDYKAALDHARQVLEDPATPESVKGNIRRFIQQIEAASKPHAFAFYGAAGLMHDSNASAGPSSTTYQFGSSTVTLAPGSTKVADEAMTLTAGLAHRYLSETRAKLLAEEGAFLWQSQVLAHRVDYRKQNDFDFGVLTFVTGPAWIFPPRMRLQAPVQLDRLQLADSDYLDIAGVTPAFVLNVGGGRDEVKLDAQIQKRDYKRMVDTGRDSSYQSAGLQYGHLGGGDEISWHAGARAFRENADAGQFDNHGYELFAGLSKQFSQDTTAYVRFTHLRIKYDQQDPIALMDRADTEQRIALGASHRLTTLLSEKWTLNVNLLDIRHKSPVGFYEFDRRQIGANVTYNF